MHKGSVTEIMHDRIDPPLDLKGVVTQPPGSDTCHKNRDKNG